MGAVRGVWIEPEPIETPASLRAAVGGHPLLAGILLQRGIDTPEAARSFLDPRYYRTAPPADLPDLPAAVERLAQALVNGEHVVVWGDFDVDGQTATAILMAGLTLLGFKASYYIPHRLDESHGLNRAGLDGIIAEGARLLVTCDCGTSDAAEVEYARHAGMDVIISDHHDPHYDPPACSAVVNPKYLPAGHPLYALSGAGVAYKLVEGLLERFGRAGMAADLLDLAALGTLADVVPLLAENRYIVQRGMPALVTSRRVGLQALVAMANIELSDVDADPLTYELAPALNAAGRLDTAEIAVRLLLTTDRGEADRLAEQVIRLNEERRYQTGIAERLALDMVEAMPRPLPPALVLAHPSWHPGVTGIVAGRLSEAYNRPAILVSLTPAGVARGSARSVPGIDVHQAIVEQRDLLLAEGGHPMAAGFGILPDNLDAFRARLVKSIGRMSQGPAVDRPLRIDAAVAWSDLTLGLCDDIYRLAPFGEANRAPVFMSRELSLVSMRLIGDRGEHLSLRLADTAGLEQDILWWHADRSQLPRGPMDVAFTVRPNVYNGTRRLQLVLAGLRRTPSVAIQVAEAERAIAVVDERGRPDVRQLLQGWLDRVGEGEPAVCWGEGRAPKSIAGLRRRDQIRPAETLAIWTIPPGPDELRAALEASGAGRLVLLCGDGAGTDPKRFLSDLLGLVKFTVARRGGQTLLEALAGVLAERRGSVLAGLAVLAELGICRFDLLDVDGVALEVSVPESAGLPAISTAPSLPVLQNALAESAAYRRYFARSAPAALLPAGFTVA